MTPSARYLEGPGTQATAGFEVAAVDELMLSRLARIELADVAFARREKRVGRGRKPAIVAAHDRHDALCVDCQRIREVVAATPDLRRPHELLAARQTRVEPTDERGIDAALSRGEGPRCGGEVVRLGESRHRYESIRRDHDVAGPVEVGLPMYVDQTSCAVPLRRGSSWLKIASVAPRRDEL